MRISSIFLNYTLFYAFDFVRVKVESSWAPDTQAGRIKVAMGIVEQMFY